MKEGRRGARHKEQDPRRKLKTSEMSQELEDRFHLFGKRVRDFWQRLKWDAIDIEYIRQVIRSSGSIGANYIEASDDLGKLDEKMKIKISSRESKETIHWLDLILTHSDEPFEKLRLDLIDECTQIKKLLSTILKKLS